MRHHKEEPISLLVKEFLRTYGLETPLNEHRAIQAWERVIGERLKSYTTALYIKNRVLFIKVRSAALRENLSQQHHFLAQRINQEVGAQVIEDIRFY